MDANADDDMEVEADHELVIIPVRDKSKGYKVSKGL